MKNLFPFFRFFVLLNFVLKRLNKFPISVSNFCENSKGILANIGIIFSTVYYIIFLVQHKSNKIDLLIKKIFYVYHLTVVQPGTAPVHFFAEKGQVFQPNQVEVFGVLKKHSPFKLN